jgi:Mn2+/Fe2+ NRAMP family transporter
MAQWLLTRRQAVAAGVGVIAAGLSGCGAAAPAGRVVLEGLKRVPWDKVSTIVVNVLTGIAVVIGLVDGKEVKAEVSLTKAELEEIKKGYWVVVEVKDGSKDTVKPKVEGK